MILVLVLSLMREYPSYFDVLIAVHREALVEFNAHKHDDEYAASLNP